MTVSGAPAARDPSADAGLFGPQSVTWRVHADPSMALAGLRALLLQAVHPVAMAGVAAHSDFRADPWGRLFRTAEYVGVVTFGTCSQAARAGARVRGVHRRYGGVEAVSGRSYRVDDADLLRWVHVVEAESFLSTAVRSGLRLTGAEQDAYYLEQRRAAALVGLTADEVPGSRAEVAAYYDEVRPQLRVEQAARDAAAFVLWPPMPLRVQLGTPARAAWAGLATAAFAMLPRWARRLYALPGLPTTDLAASLTGRALRSGLLVVPDRWRQGPHVTEARARLGLA